MANVLYLASTLERCGPVNQLYDLIANLDRTRFTPLVATLSPEPASTRAPDFEALEIKVLNLGLSRIEGLSRARPAIQGIIRHHNIALVHSQGIRGDILTSRIAGPVRVATIHNYPSEDYRRTYGVLKGFLMALMHLRAARHLDAVIGVSTAVSENLIRAHGLSDAQPISNGVDTRALTPADRKEKHALRQTLGLPQLATLWVSAGHLSQRKDPLTLIRAWRAASTSGNDRCLLMLGDGPLMADCKAAAGADPSIRFAGNLNSITDHLRASDIFVSASRAEGLPLATLEAMACGLPLRLSEIAPHREVWETDPTMGDLFPVGSETALAALIAEARTEELATAAAAARQMAETRFSAKTMTNAYMNFYDRLLRGRRV